MPDTCPTHACLVEAVHLGAERIVLTFACGCVRCEAAKKQTAAISGSSVGRSGRHQEELAR